MVKICHIYEDAQNRPQNKEKFGGVSNKIIEPPEVYKKIKNLNINKATDQGWGRLQLMITITIMFTCHFYLSITIMIMIIRNYNYRLRL